jgi:hypothetical protein
MKTPKWTRADAKRAEKMGWVLNDATLGMVHISKHGDRFKSDDEAIEFVMRGYQESLCSKPLSIAEWDVCRKAIRLCMKG